MKAGLIHERRLKGKARGWAGDMFALRPRPLSAGGGPYVSPILGGEGWGHVRSGYCARALKRLRAYMSPSDYLCFFIGWTARQAFTASIALAMWEVGSIRLL